MRRSTSRSSAGAAGALLAAKLGEAGLSVVVFEAGPDWQASDLVSSQIWSRRLRWGGPSVATTGPESIGFGFNAGWGVGGAALHHYGTWPRLKSADFTMLRDHGRGCDWPIDYDVLRPWCDRIQTEVGVSGDAVAEVRRPAGAPYPMPPLPSLRQGTLLAGAFAKVGIRTAPAPMAINTTEYGSRPPCQYDGWCDAGCPIGALANPQAIYLPKTKAAGVRVIADAPVIAIVTNRGDRVDGIDYLAGGRERRRQRARLVILARSIVGNPALMLQSAGPAHPRGIGNANDFVGRGVMTHGLVQVLGVRAAFHDRCGWAHHPRGKGLLLRTKHLRHERLAPDPPGFAYSHRPGAYQRRCPAVRCDDGQDVVGR